MDYCKNKKFVAIDRDGIQRVSADNYENCFSACKKFVSSQPKKAQSRFKQMRIMSVRSKDGR
jgi:hypothetical protein